MWHEACLICGRPRLKMLSRYAHAHLVRCLECGLTFAGRRPTDAELASHYESYGTDWHDSPVTRRRYEELLDSFEPYRQTNRILDVGCGAGFFLEAARRRGWDAYGSEFSLRAFELCRAKQLTVVQAPLTAEAFDPGSFDVVTAFEVVEHLRDPAPEADMIKTLLRHGGLFYCTTPNFNAASRRLLAGRWAVVEYPEHLCYFTDATLRAWLARTGLASLGVTTTGCSPSGLRRSLKPDAGLTGAGDSEDERLRAAVERSPLLRLAKVAVNGALSAANAGDTLKGRFELTATTR